MAHQGFGQSNSQLFWDSRSREAAPSRISWWIGKRATFAARARLELARIRRTREGRFSGSNYLDSDSVMRRRRVGHE